MFPVASRKNLTTENLFLPMLFYCFKDLRKLETKQKLNIKDYLKPKSFQTVKETNTTINRQPVSWEETLAIILLEKSPRRYVIGQQL